MPTFTGTAGDDNLTAGEGDDVISGLGGDDVLIGAGGDDILSGGPGRNYLDGGPGNDTATYLDATSAVTVSLAVTGFQTTGYSTDQLVSINRLIGSQLYGDILTGSAVDDVIDTGSRLAPRNTGFQGYAFGNANDLVFGGSGNDTITAEGVSNGSILNGEGGDDIVNVGFSGIYYIISRDTTWYAFDGAPIRVNGGDGADRLTVVGHAIIDGGAGDDGITVGVGPISQQVTFNSYFLSPGATDTTVQLTGGAGADTFRIWNPVGTAIVTDFNVATDLIDLSYSILSHANPSDSRRQVYVGQQGADTIFFGRRTDGSIDATYGRLLNVDGRSIPQSSYLNNDPGQFSTGPTVQSESVIFVGTAGNDSVAGWSEVLGGAGDDSLTAVSTGSVLYGEAGDDSLISGAGNDTLTGGAGTDIAIYSDATAGVTVNLTAGTATGGGGSDILRGIEGVTGSRFGDILTGSAGADSLRGGRGLDMLTGGAGSDAFVFAADDSVGSAIDSITDFQTGIDTVVIEGATSDGISLVRTDDGGTLIFARHSSGAQTVIGSNRVVQAGDVFGSGGLVLRANMVGSDGSDGLIGSSLGDSLNGGAGDDFITGGLGNDNLYGGAGADQFIYRSAAESAAGASDVINDFETEIDTINLNSILPTSITIRRADNNASFIEATITGQQTLVVVAVGLIQGSDFLLAGRTNIPVTMIGTRAAEILIGSVAADVLIGGGGADTLTGGLGADTFRYLAISDSTAASQDLITDFQTGVDRIDLTAISPTSISVALFAGLESLVFAETSGGSFQLFAQGAAVNATDFTYNGTFGVYVIGSGDADTILGSVRADPLVGNGGDDVITGGGGADAISGGAGRDTFRYVAASDSSQATGFDNLYDFVTGEDRIDLTTMAPTSISIIRSDNGSSFIFAETPAGGFLTTAASQTVQATDIVYGSGAGGVGGFGIYLVGSGGADVLVGTSLADPISGGAGDDRITGGGGADAMFGDAGADTFVYTNRLDSTVAAADGIFGFVSGQDRIDLTGVRTGASDTLGLAYIGTGSFIFVDLGGDGVNDMLIQLSNTRVVASDILWTPAALLEEASVKDAGRPVLPGLEGAEDITFDLSGFGPHTGQTMLEIDPAATRGGYHGQDWYL